MYFLYESQSHKSGIYAIYNRLSNGVYIGQAKRFKERWRPHKSQLKKNKHHNPHLQYSYNYYKQIEIENGSNNPDWFIEFHIIEVMENSTQEQRIKRENFWKKQHQKFGFKLYSEKEVNSNGKKICWSYNPHKTKQKLSLSHKSFYKTPNGLKQREEIGNLRRGKTYEEMYGEERAKVLKEKSNERFSGKNNPMLGKRGMKNHFSKIYDLSSNPLISPTGEKFMKIECLSEFCRKYNLNQSHISGLIQEKRKTHKGWYISNSIHDKLNK